MKDLFNWAQLEHNHNKVRSNIISNIQSTTYQLCYLLSRGTRTSSNDPIPVASLSPIQQEHFCMSVVITTT